MKSKNILMRELKAELHYWQMQARMAAKGLKSTRRKCKEIGAKLRELQKAGSQ